MTALRDKEWKALDEAALDALFHDSDRDDDVDANVNRAESSRALAADQALLAGLEQDTQTALELPEQISGAVAGCRFGLQHQSVGRPPENRNSSGANSSHRVPWTKASRQRSRLRPAMAICLILAGVLSALPWGTWTSATKTAEVPWRQASFVPLSKSIEELRVGERVRSDNPDSAFENAPTAVEPPSWRKLRLMAATTWEDGTQDDIQIETLCPKTWLTDFDFRVGSSVPVPLDLVEMGLPAGLQAEVLSVEECPRISDGTGQVILTTVNHLNRDLWELTLTNGDGTSETVRPTAPHKFYSATRSGWFSASELKVGEEIAGASGRSLIVAATRQVVGVQRVYNMTVEGEHVYYVSRLGALVHNQACDPFGTPSGTVYRGTDSKSGSSIANSGLDAKKAKKAAGDAGMDDKGFSVTTNPDTAKAWAEARAAERGGDPVVLQANASDLPLKPGGPGEWTDPDEFFVPLDEYGKVGPGVFKPNGP